jgi:hypothetical protein
MYLNTELFLSVIFYIRHGYSGHENTNFIHCKYIYYTFHIS